MKVTLINYDADAVNQLIFTKSTRLTLAPGLLEEIRAWPEERKAEELRYIANSIKSSWEFVSYTFLIEGASRGFTHQFVRTRNASYAQQSMRVNDMSNYAFVTPERIEKDEGADQIVKQINYEINVAYRKLLSHGIPEEDARCILPTNIATNIVVKHNLRSLSELGISRIGGRTQAEYREIMNAMVDAVLAVHPWAKEFVFGEEGRNYFDELEAFASKKFPDLKERGELLKIVDKMRGAKK